jgi:hypothetical protein
MNAMEFLNMAYSELSKLATITERKPLAHLRISDLWDSSELLPRIFSPIGPLAVRMQALATAFQYFSGMKCLFLIDF